MSAAGVVQVALMETLLADAGLIALLGADKVFVGEAPKGTVLPYAILRETLEDTDRKFNQRRGYSGEERIHVWATTRAAALAIHAALEAALDGVKLTLTAGTMSRADVGLVTCFPEPDKVWHAVTSYEHWTKP